jgi:hypothetical protein
MRSYCLKHGFAVSAKPGSKGYEYEYEGLVGWLKEFNRKRSWNWKREQALRLRPLREKPKDI